MPLTIIYIKEERTVSVAHLATTNYHRTGIFLNFLHLVQLVRRICESLSIDNLSHLAFFQTLCRLHDQDIILLVSFGNLWIDIELQKLVLALTIIIYVEVERLAAVGKVLETKSDSFTLVGSASMFFDCSVYGSVLTVIVNKLPLVSFSARNSSDNFVCLTFLSLGTFAIFSTADFFLLIYSCSLLACSYCRSRMLQGRLHCFQLSRQEFLHSLVLDSFCLLQGLGIDSLSLVIVLRKQIKLQELIRPLSTFVSVEINRLCAIRQILVAYAHRFIVTSHVTLLFILLIVILRDLLLTVQRYEK